MKWGGEGAKASGLWSPLAPSGGGGGRCPAAPWRLLCVGRAGGCASAALSAGTTHAPAVATPLRSLPAGGGRSSPPPTPGRQSPRNSCASRGAASSGRPHPTRSGCSCRGHTEGTNSGSERYSCSWGAMAAVRVASEPSQGKRRSHHGCSRRRPLGSSTVMRSLSWKRDGQFLCIEALQQQHCGRYSAWQATNSGDSCLT